MNNSFSMRIFFILFFLYTDAMILHEGKHLLLQFLTGIVNKKKWSAFHRQQKWTDKLTLNYIAPLLKKHTEEFQRLHRLYQIVLYSAIPQYILFLILSLVMGKSIRFVYYIFLGFRVIMLFIFRLQTDNNHQLKIVQKKKRP